MVRVCEQTPNNFFPIYQHLFYFSDSTRGWFGCAPVSFFLGVFLSCLMGEIAIDLLRPRFRIIIQRCTGAFLPPRQNSCHHKMKGVRGGGGAPAAPTPSKSCVPLTPRLREQRKHMGAFRDGWAALEAPRQATLFPPSLKVGERRKCAGACRDGQDNFAPANPGGTQTDSAFHSLLWHRHLPYQTPSPAHCCRLPLIKSAI